MLKWLYFFKSVEFNLRHNYNFKRTKYKLIKYNAYSVFTDIVSVGLFFLQLLNDNFHFLIHVYELYYTTIVW